MGYDVFITRADLPEESRKAPISSQEWTALVKSDSSLRISPTDYYEHKSSDGGTERIPTVIWTAHPGQPPFLLLDGAVQIKSPDKATIEKMMAMAAKLQARVVGEEGELYSSDSVAPEGVVAKAGTSSWPLWKKMVIAFFIGCVLLGLRLLILRR
jgi:hypothetical protein